MTDAPTLGLFVAAARGARGCSRAGCPLHRRAEHSDGAAAWLQIMVPGLMFTLIALSSDSLWALAAGTIGGWLKRSRGYLAVRRWVTGTVFVGLGLSATRSA